MRVTGKLTDIFYAWWDGNLGSQLLEQSRQATARNVLHPHFRDLSIFEDKFHRYLRQDNCLTRYRHGLYAKLWESHVSSVGAGDLNQSFNHISMPVQIAQVIGKVGHTCIQLRLKCQKFPLVEWLRCPANKFEIGSHIICSLREIPRLQGCNESFYNLLRIHRHCLLP